MSGGWSKGGAAGVRRGGVKDGRVVCTGVGVAVTGTVTGEKRGWRRVQGGARARVRLGGYERGEKARVDQGERNFDKYEGKNETAYPMHCAPISVRAWGLHISGVLSRLEGSAADWYVCAIPKSVTKKS